MKITKNEWIALSRIVDFVEKENFYTGFDCEDELFQKIKNEAQKTNLPRCPSCLFHIYKDQQQWSTEDGQYFCSEVCLRFYEEKNGLGKYKEKVICAYCKKNIPKITSVGNGEHYFCNKKEAEEYYYRRLSQKESLSFTNFSSYLNAVKENSKKLKSIENQTDF